MEHQDSMKYITVGSDLTAEALTLHYNNKKRLLNVSIDTRIFQAKRRQCNIQEFFLLHWIWLGRGGGCCALYIRALVYIIIH